MIFWILAICLGAALATDCLDTWIPFQGSCYHFETNMALKFSEAEHYCQTRDARLVHVDNSDENTFIKSYLIANKHDDSWIGLTDIDTEGLWQWYDTSTKLNFTDWAPGMPDGNSNSNCAQYYHSLDYKWDDTDCNNDFNQPICEIRKGSSVDIIG